MRQRGQKSARQLALVAGSGANRARLQTPAGLAAGQRVLFNTLIDNAPAGHFTENDKPILAAYCKAVTLCDHYAALAATDPESVRPYLLATKAMGLLASKLRLAPQSRITPRTAHRMATNTQPRSAYDLLDQIEVGDDDG